MDNRLSILMFIAMIGYVVFCVIKSRQLAKIENIKSSNTYFGIVVVGLCGHCRDAPILYA